jgi:hypothetical protein
MYEKVTMFGELVKTGDELEVAYYEGTILAFV